MTNAFENKFSEQIRKSLYGKLETQEVFSDANGGLTSWFDVTGLCIATIGAACAEVAAFGNAGVSEKIDIDGALASYWFGMTIRPQGWQLPPIWDDIAGNYQTRDGEWIRLHTNAKRHRAAALHVLDCAATKDAVTRSVFLWRAADLEASIVNSGGCAAEMRSLDAWRVHPQGSAVATEPLIAWDVFGGSGKFNHDSSDKAPLAGLKILDCTRVLAGPVCTRFLAGYGAEVLRIDPPGWNESNIVPEVTLGKRTATLDLKTIEDRSKFTKLLKQADVFVHGYRPGAMEALGFDRETLRHINPDLTEVTLNAYGWTGPWSERRGYDSLVQMSSGIAHLGMMRSKTGKPHPLPVQALDHATGYLMAASVVRALRLRKNTGVTAFAKLSLARTAKLLINTLCENTPSPLRSENHDDLMSSIEATDWGPAGRIKFPVRDITLQPKWIIPAGELHKESPDWTI